MDLIKCLIKNLRVSEDPTATRLIKFTKANETSDFLISPEIPSIASGTDGFKICLAPVILPGPCDNAINHVGFTYYRRINGITFELKNRITDELIASGPAEEYWDVIDAINTSSIVSARGIEGNDGTPGIVLQNVSNEDLRLLLTFFTVNSEDNPEVYQNYEDDYYNDIDENPTYNQIDDNSFEVCLLASACSTEIKTLQLKKPSVDLREHTLVVKYLTESSGFTETFTETLVYSGDYDDPTSITYNADFAETVCESIRYKFEQYSNIIFENSQPENVISPVNNCVDNRGDVQFELRLNGLNTSINPIDLIMTEDRGVTLIKVSTPATADKNAALNNLASQLVAYGYTSVADANNARITLKKSDIRSLSVITNGYTSHSFSVDGSDWGYDGDFLVEGDYRDNVAVRPMSCTLGLKDPNRNFENYLITFKGYPLRGSFPVNFTKVTILPVADEFLEEGQLDFLTTLTDLTSFSFETCETYLRGYE